MFAEPFRFIIKKKVLIGNQIKNKAIVGVGAGSKSHSKKGFQILTFVTFG